MKLNLEVFSEVLYLDLKGEISDNLVKVLNAGILRLCQLPQKWVLIDLTRTQVAPGLIESIIQIEQEIRGTHMQCVWIGEYAELCNAKSIWDAINYLEERKTKEAGLLRRFFELREELVQVTELADRYEAHQASKATLEQKKAFLTEEQKRFTGNRSLQSFAVNELVRIAYRPRSIKLIRTELTEEQKDSLFGKKEVS